MITLYVFVSCQFVENLEIISISVYIFSDYVKTELDEISTRISKLYNLIQREQGTGSMLILCIFGGIVQKIIGVTVVYTENICSRHFLIKIGRHILCMKSYGIKDSELTH